MVDKVGLLQLMDYSNLRVRVKLSQVADGDRRGSRADNDFGFCGGVDVWLDDFMDMTFGDLDNALRREEFAARPDLRAFVIMFHYMNGDRWEALILQVERDEPLTMSYLLHGGLPVDVDDAWRLVEQAFIPVGASVQGVEHVPASDECDEDYWWVKLKIDDAAATLEAAREAARKTRSALCTYRGELGPDCRTAFKNDLLAGHLDAVIGVCESEWLECKADIALGSREGNEVLLKAVSGLANGHRAGFLAVGLRTRRVNDHDEVVDVTPVSRRVHTAERYRKIIDSHIYPPIRGLEVDLVPRGDGVVVLVTVPAQREADKLFVVSRGAERQIYLRRGDRTEPLSMPDVHALLAAGYRNLGRGAGPNLDG